MASKYVANLDNKFVKLPNTTLGTYNSWDAHLTARLVKPLLEEVTNNNQRDYYLSHVAPLQEAVVAMSRRGMLLDTAARSKYIQELIITLKEVDNVIVYLSGDPDFNPRSPIQRAAWLYDKIGILPQKGRSTDQEALTRALRKLRVKDKLAGAEDAIHCLFHRSRLDTILRRYMPMTPGHDGRIRPRVKMAKIKTNRLACSDPPMQQIPPEARKVFIPAPGKLFLSVDYSQLEARLLAHFSNDEKSLAVFASGGDVHRANAAELFDCDPISISDAQRDYGKAFLYRICYGGEGSEKEKTFCPCVRWGCASSLPATVDLTREQKLAAEARWFREHDAVRVYQRDLVDFVRRKHYYDHPLGGRRYFAAPFDSELERELKNEPMQRGGAILMARAQIRLHNEFNAPIVLQMHDEFLLEVPEKELSTWAEIVQDVMQTPIPELNNATIKTDVAVGRNWGKYKPTTNPDGMRDL